MKEYRILHDYAGKELEKDVNELAAQGFVIDKVLQQSDNGTYICIIMVRDQEELQQKETAKQLAAVYKNTLEKLNSGDYDDFDEDDLNKTINDIYGKIIS